MVWYNHFKEILHHSNILLTGIAIKLLTDVLIICFIEPLNEKDPISEQGAFYQHILTRVTQFYLKDMSRFDRSNPYYSFISNSTWKIFFKARAFMQSKDVIELSKWEDIQEPNGVLITAEGRSKAHDIIVFYVPNFALFGCQPYFYAEFLVTLHSLLLLQGFNSPSIFIMEFPEACKRAALADNLVFLIESWNKLVDANPHSKFVIFGESLGATLVLMFLLHQSGDLEIITTNFNNLVGRKIVKSPFGGIVISPIIDPGYENNDYEIDLLRPCNIQGITQHAFKSHDWSPIHVESMEVWSNAIPKGGFLLIWGDKEYQSSIFDQFSMLLMPIQRVKVVKGRNRGHCWPIVSFLTEDSQDEKEDSCFLIAGILSRIVLYATQEYRDTQKAYEPMNVLTIDDYHL